MLGDFNIEKRREDDPLCGAFTSQGLTVPDALRDVQSNYAQDATHHDHIGWFMGDLNLPTAAMGGVHDRPELGVPRASEMARRGRSGPTAFRQAVSRAALKSPFQTLQRCACSASDPCEHNDSAGAVSDTG